MVEKAMWNKISRYRWILISIWIVIIYWMLETIFDILVLGGSFESNFIHIDTHELWMRTIIVSLILFLGIYAQSRFKRRKKNENRIKRLNSLLYSIRNINQIIVQKQNLKTILVKSVNTLMKTRGYLDIFIAIKTNNHITPVAHAGKYDMPEWTIDLNDDETPRCVGEVLKSKKIEIIKDPVEYCSECELCTHEEEHRKILLPMKSHAKIIGILGASIEQSKPIEKDEISLLKEVSNDLAYATDKFRIKKEKDIFERKKDFLNTILRQDLRSKSQLATGYLQLIEEDDLPSTNREYLKSALQSNQSMIDLIEEVNHLKEVEELDELGKTDVVHIIDGLIEEFSKDDKIRIINNIDMESLVVKGDHSLKYLFNNLIKVRTKDLSDPIEIRFSLREKEDQVIISIEDDEEEISDTLKKALLESPYVGKTAGKEGSRYYIIRELIDHTKGNIEIKDSSLGGARFDITLNKE